MNQSISVSEPHQTGGNGYFVYKLKGTDEKGEFEVERRFKEFETFRECISKRFPGFFIPPIPKKVMNNKGEDVLKERTYLLNRFIGMLSTNH